MISQSRECQCCVCTRYKMLLIVTCACIGIVILYIKILKPRQYWQDKGIPYLKPWPILGNMAQNFLSTRSFAHIIQDMYQTFPDERYFGFHHFSKPAIMLRDPDLIKQICIRDADIFQDHPPFLPEDGDPFFSKNLLSLKGKAWHRMRSTISPAFTSSKLKTMFGLMKECSKQFVTYFENQNGEDHLNVRDAFTRFNNDIAASLVLGVRCDSMRDRDNRIYTITKKQLNDIPFYKFFGYALSPTLMKIFKITFFNSSFSAFLSQIIQETMQAREELKIIRPDMLHLLMEAKKGRLKNGKNYSDGDEGFAIVQESEISDNRLYKITDEDIVAQAALLYTGSFDTSSNLMCVLAYELAVNSDVQEKLKCEVDKTLKKCGGELTYTALLEMKYLDMVVSETLRLWPVTTFSDRVAAKPYIIESSKPDEKSVKVEAGTYVWLPLYAIQRDAQYFPNPDKFDPERFSDENKRSIIPFTYIPFGLGPRGCIATRFALLEAKVIIFYIISQFEIVPVKETQIPYVLNKKVINIVNEGNLVLGLKCRHC